MYRAVIFDLDGTLIDSAPDIAAAVNRVLAGIGREGLPVATVERFIGDGARSMLRRIFGEIGAPDDATLLERSLESYLTHYGAAPAVKTKLFPHVMEDLRDLRRAGLRLGVCTNKPHHLTELVLAGLGLDALIEVALGADAVPRRKPDAEHLLAVIAAMELNPREVIYVGDTEIDRRCAGAAEVPFCVVSWGGGAAVSDEDAHRISRIAAVSDVIESLEAREAAV